MSYDPLTPSANQFISASQPIIQGNFAKADSDFSVDHKSFQTAVGSGQGEHKKITFNDVTAIPGLAAPKASLYTRTLTDVKVAPFFQNDAAATDEFPMFPGLAAWVAANGVTGVIQSSFNVVSVIHAGVGSYFVTFQKPFLAADYCVCSTSNMPVGGGFAIHTIINRAVGGCTIQYQNQTNAFTHAVDFFAVFYGRLT